MVQTVLWTLECPQSLLDKVIYVPVMQVVQVVKIPVVAQRGRGVAALDRHRAKLLFDLHCLKEKEEDEEEEKDEAASLIHLDIFLRPLVSGSHLFYLVLA